MESKFIKLFELVKENYDTEKVTPGCFAVLNKTALKDKDIRDTLTRKHGSSFILQLDKLAKDEQVLFVSAMKTHRPSSVYISETPPGNFEEADVVNHKVPGLYSNPMTVPVSVLTKIRESGDVMQQTMDDEFVHKPKLGNETQDDSYNKGKQPKGTRKNGGNN